jgi:hypothetical protein
MEAPIRPAHTAIRTVPVEPQAVKRRTDRQPRTRRSQRTYPHNSTDHPHLRPRQELEVSIR